MADTSSPATGRCERRSRPPRPGRPCLLRDVTRKFALIAAAALLATGCDGRGAGEIVGGDRPADAEDLSRASQVAREYLAAAGDGDTERLCDLRTRRTGCERAAEQLPVNPASARVVPEETTGMGRRARVVIDFGEAALDSGRVVGGEILEMDLRLENGEYRVARLGLASFAD